VGRAIKFLDSKEKRGRWTIKLKQPAQYFRLVEDEPETSYIDWIFGDGELGLHDVVTSPASYLGAHDGSVHEFEFSKPVSVLETHGYYEYRRN
jgi:hypothetical protein